MKIFKLYHKYHSSLIRSENLSFKERKKEERNAVGWEHTSISTSSQVEGSSEVPHLYSTVGVSGEDVPPRA